MSWNFKEKNKDGPNLTPATSQWWLDLAIRPTHSLKLINCVATGGVDLEQYHAMSVTEWLDVETASGARLTLLRIRNPWGRRGTWMEGWGPTCIWGKAALGASTSTLDVDAPRVLHN